LLTQERLILILLWKVSNFVEWRLWNSYLCCSLYIDFQQSQMHSMNVANYTKKYLFLEDMCFFLFLCLSLSTSSYLHVWIWWCGLSLQIKCPSFRDNTALVMRQLIIICEMIISSCNMFEIELLCFCTA